MCKICNYNMVKTIDRLLLAGSTPAELSRTYAFTVAELERHQQHLLHKMARVQKRFHAHLNLGLYCKLNNVMEMVLWVIRQSKGSEHVKSFLQAGREFTRIMTLMDKMAARLQVDPEFIYCLLANPQWELQEDSHLPYAYQALSAARQTLKQDLFSPCPEAAPALSPAFESPPASPQVDRASLPIDPDSGPLPRVAAVPARPTGPEPQPANLRAVNAT
jgi:hypothetical protein